MRGGADGEAAEVRHDDHAGRDLAFVFFRLRARLLALRLFHVGERIRRRLDFQVAQELREDALRDRRGDLAAVKVARARVVDHDEHDDLRVFDGREAAERRDVAPFHVAGAVRADFLRRAGLAGDAVAFDSRLLAAARGDDLFEEADERLVRRGLERAADFLALVFQVRRAVGVLDGLHDVRLQHDAVVRDGGHGAHELDRRDGDGLADGRRRDVGRAHVLGVEQDAGLFARQADVRHFAEPEGLRVLHEIFRAEAQANLREAGVERLLDDVRERDRAEARAVPVLDAAARDHDVARVDEDLVRRDDFFLERRARDDGLERRARLVDERDGAVLPRLRRVVVELVRIVRRPRGHGEHVARLRVHDDARDSRRIVLGHGAVELLLDGELHRAVNRELDRLALVAAVCAALEHGLEDRPRALVREELALRDLTLDEAVARLLDAVEALVLRADEADDIRREHVVRIKALRLVAEADAVRELLVADERARGLVLVLREEMFQPDEAAAVGDGRADVVGLEADERREACRDLFLIFVCRVVRVDEDGFRHRADGELAAVAVEDRAARRLHLVVRLHLRLQALREVAPLHELHIGIAHDDEADEGDHGDEAVGNARLDLMLSLLRAHAFRSLLQNGNSLPYITQATKRACGTVHRLSL